MRYDVVIIGGAFSGAAAALLLRRELPSLSILIVEAKESFDRKVGEATTEVSGCFLTKRLALTNHLLHHHIAKQGLRMWFTSPERPAFEDCVEIGANYQVKLPSYQVDREVLDLHVLDLARTAGAELWRPAKLVSATSASSDAANGTAGANASHTLEIRVGEETRRVECRWLLDASGRASFLARKRGSLKGLTEHPTNAMWARLRGVRDWDGHDVRSAFPKYAGRVHTSRTAATNHLTGYGWWCWIIPLKGGDTSVGLVYDSRLYSPPSEGRIGERLLSHVRAHPIGREIFRDAEVIEGDQKAYSALPYYAEEIAGEGWQIIGDAAGFLDPLYSQGLDYCSWTVSLAVDRIARESRGESVDFSALNARFRESLLGWFRALYKDKYYYLGDAELMTAAFLMDIGLFFFGPVREVIANPSTGFNDLPFTGPADRQVCRLMSFYNRRLATLARERQEFGCYGKWAPRPSETLAGFEPNNSVWKLVLRGARLWGRAEWRNARLRAGKRATPEPSPLLPIAPASPASA